MHAFCEAAIGLAGFLQLRQEPQRMPCTARRFEVALAALLKVIEFLEHYHRNEDVMLLKRIRRASVMDQNIRVEDIEALRFLNDQASTPLVSGCQKASICLYSIVGESQLRATLFGRFGV